MDSPFLSGEPAFTALVPRFPEPRAASPAMAELASSYCGERVDVDALGDRGPGVAGRYRVRRATGEVLFLKVFPDEILEVQRDAARIAGYLHGAGCSTVAALPGEPRPFSTGFHAILSPYIDARFSDFSPDDLAQAGRLVAEAHGHLAGLPTSGDVEREAERLDARLRVAARDVADGWMPPGGSKPHLEASARSYLANRLVIHEHPQVVHGDCNYTNVLFERATGQGYLVDFEETRAAWLSPLFDLAFLVQRFALVAPDDDVTTRAQALVGGYTSVRPLRHPGPDLWRACIEVVDRSMLILCVKVQDGMQAPAAEWKKFEGLRDVLPRHRTLLDVLSEDLA